MAPGPARGRELRGEWRGGGSFSSLLQSQACYLGQLTRGQGFFFFFFLECLLGGQEFIRIPIGWVSGKEYI